MLKLNDLVKITSSDENNGKVGKIVFLEEKKGFRGYPYFNCTVDVEGVELKYPHFKLDPEIDRVNTFDKKMLKGLEVDVPSKKNKKVKQTLNDDKENHCINYTTDVILHGPDEGHITLTGDNFMSTENTAVEVEQEHAQVAAQAEQAEQVAQPKRSGRPKGNPNTALARAKQVYIRMQGSKRADIIAAFVSEVGIKEGSASVYYYNIKKSLGQ